MQIGIDCDGTIVRFLVVVNSGACDVVVHGPFKNLDVAKEDAKRVLEREHFNHTIVRVVEEQTSYKRVWEIEDENV